MSCAFVSDSTTSILTHTLNSASVICSFIFSTKCSSRPLCLVNDLEVPSQGRSTNSGASYVEAFALASCSDSDAPSLVAVARALLVERAVVFTASVPESFQLHVTEAVTILGMESFSSIETLASAQSDVTSSGRTRLLFPLEAHL